jgi:hypothetical protein
LGEKLALFVPDTASFLQTLVHSIGIKKTFLPFFAENWRKSPKIVIITLLLRKTQFFRRKLGGEIAENCDHNVAFKKNAIFCRKLSKVAENCDHNIDPRWERKAIFLE